MQENSHQLCQGPLLASKPRAVFGESGEMLHYPFLQRSGNIPFRVPFGAPACHISSTRPSPFDYRLRHSTSTTSHDHKFIGTHSLLGPGGLWTPPVCQLQRWVTGRLLVTIDEWSGIFSFCWSCVDSPNQFAHLPWLRPVVLKATPRMVYGSHDPATSRDTNTFSTVTPNSLSIRGTVVDVPLASLETTANMHVRCLAGSHLALNLALERFRVSTAVCRY